MARPLRIQYDGAVYHITSRGNARKAIFKGDADRELFLETLHKVKKRYNWLCHAYCLMNNHYHLIVETPDGNLARGMRQLNGVYTQAYNARHSRVGHILQGRYKAILIQKESHLLEVCRYVVLNPVRAKTVQRPDQWKWSSYLATSGKSTAHPCLNVEWVLEQFGARRKQAEERYREFVQGGIGGKEIWSEVKGQSILGEEEFSVEMEEYVKGSRDMTEIPRMQRYAARPELRELLGKTDRQSRKVEIKRMRDAVDAYGYSQREVATYLGVHYSTVSRMLRREKRQIATRKT